MVHIMNRYMWVICNLFLGLLMAEGPINAEGMSLGPADRGNYDLLNTISSSNVQNHIHFVVVSAAYNNIAWIERHMNSVISQTYKNWELIYINDASRDGTADAVESFIKEKNIQSKVTLINNKVRRDKLPNVYDAIHSCNPRYVIVMLDADDWFYDETVLDYLAHVYQDPSVWLTYGSYLVWPSGQMGEWANELPASVIKDNSFRRHPWSTSHLKTFYAGLFQKIRREDLMWSGQFIILIDDVAFMLPMLEMAGEHSRFISKLLYVFNWQNGASHTERNHLLGMIDYHVRFEIKPYERLERLF